MEKELKTYRELPKGVFSRTRRGKEYFFCYVGKGADRSEVSLGGSVRGLFAKYEAVRDGVTTGNRVPKDYARALYLRAKKSAQVRGIDFSISEGEIVEKLIASGGKCAITGLRFSMEKVDGVRIRPWMPSLDRIDAAVGYTAPNCRIVCAAVNLALNQFGEKMFYKIAYATILKTKFCGTE